MQVSSRWLKLCCSLEFGDCGVAVGVQAGVQAQDTSEGTVCFRIVWSNSHSLARLRFSIFQLAILRKCIGKIDARLRGNWVSSVGRCGTVRLLARVALDLEAPSPGSCEVPDSWVQASPLFRKPYARREDFPSAAPPFRAGKLIQPVFRRASARQRTK